jgi:hypothetical protein
MPIENSTIYKLLESYLKYLYDFLYILSIMLIPSNLYYVSIV